MCKTVRYFIMQAKPEDTLDLCKILNDDLAATVRKYPTRFVGLGTLPMQHAALAVEELKRCKYELGKFHRKCYTIDIINDSL